jgi:hypothetical protein
MQKYVPGEKVDVAVEVRRASTCLGGGGVDNISTPSNMYI